MITIKSNLVRMQLFAAGIVLCIASIAFFTKDILQARTSMTQELDSISSVVAYNLVSTLVFRDYSEANKILEALKSQPFIVGAGAYDDQGKLVASYGRYTESDRLDSLSAQSVTFRSEDVLLSRPVLQDQDMVGTLQLKASLAPMKAIYWEYAWISFAVFVFCILLTLGIASYGHKSLSVPISRLAHLVREISSTGNYAMQIEKGTEGSVIEIRTLTDEFAHLLSQIQIRDKALLEANESLEKKVDERTRELRAIQQEALHNAHNAGMAEIATSVLHNVGNILNSVNIGAENILSVSKGSRIFGLVKTTTLLQAEGKNVMAFLASDPKGPMLIEYIIQVTTMLQNEFHLLSNESQQLLERIQLIKDVVTAQQSYSKGGEFKEEASLVDIIETALAMQLNSLGRHDINLIRNFQEVPPVIVQKTKLAHVLLNLFRNAKEAMGALPSDRKTLTIDLLKYQESIELKIACSRLRLFRQSC
jgi:signal transduction histidine kinase